MSAETSTPTIEPGPELQGTANQSPSTTELSSTPSAVINFEKVGLPGYQQQLGNFKRFSLLPLGLAANLGLTAASIYLLWRIEEGDHMWKLVAQDGALFPNTSGTLERPQPYFENKAIDATPLGRLLQSRYHWFHIGQFFGLARETGMQFYGIISMLVLFAICFCHFFLVCVLRRFRRKFQVISLGYGVKGLVLFTALLAHLYISLVQKVSCYLENAFHPPILNETEESQTIFIRLAYVCAFSYSSPNHYVRYPISEIRTDALVIEDMSYPYYELMELGICPKQDYLLIVSGLLAAATILSWVISAYSEVLENKILGPPIWLQRFKTKIHKGIRRWRTRTQAPTFFQTQGANIHGNSDERDHHPHHEPGNRSKIASLVDSTINQPMHAPMWDDAYNVLDGGIDHITLVQKEPVLRSGSLARVFGSQHSI